MSYRIAPSAENSTGCTGPTKSCGLMRGRPADDRGSLEYLRDRKGIYGLEWPNRHHIANGGDSCGAIPQVFRYVVRPDKLDDHAVVGAAALQAVPRRGPFRRSAEFDMARDLGQLLVVRAGLRSGRDRYGCQLKEGCRQQYWGLVRRGERTGGCAPSPLP